MLLERRKQARDPATLSGAFQPPPRATLLQSFHSPQRKSGELAAIEDSSAPQDNLIDRLRSKGLLLSAEQDPKNGLDAVSEDLERVRSLFSAQVPKVDVLGVFRIQNQTLASVYKAVRGTMRETTPELDLWHGTSVECAHNIVLHGFNRAYSGRHGTKLGLGTYFSGDAAYSFRFCGRKPGSRRVMLLAKVLVGEYAKGLPDLVEPPFCDAEQMSRFDATVDDVVSPAMYCVFRDYQALPQYLVEFVSTS